MVSLTTRFSTGQALRQAARLGQFSGQTAGQAPDHLQCNVVVLPSQYAADFILYCANNPKPCPLIGLTQPGDIDIPQLGAIDIRSDIPRYRIYRDGALEQEASDVRQFWRDDLVTVVLGCSFTFEEALINTGYTVHHVDQGRNVPMYKSSIETIPGGVFQGPMVVTMRSFPAYQIPAIFDLSAAYPHAHGTPVHWGSPSSIGIADLSQPDYGDPVEVPDDEIPVFWACGVTPQAALERARPDFCITHAPGCMLVTDVASSDVSVVRPSISQFLTSSGSLAQSAVAT